MFELHALEKIQRTSTFQLNRERRRCAFWDKLLLRKWNAEYFLDYCRDRDGNWLRDETFRVVLGPNKSFVAWDRSTIRWWNLPIGLEATIQGWLGPAGWVQGPPRIVALGKDSAFYAKSEYGATGYWIPDTSPIMRKQFDLLRHWNNMDDVEVGLAHIQFSCRNLGLSDQNVFMNPAADDSFVVVTKSTRVYAYNAGNDKWCRNIVFSFASLEN